METRVVQKDNQYFEDVKVLCCGQIYRVETGHIQWGITADTRKQNREWTLRFHVCQKDKK